MIASLRFIWWPLYLALVLVPPIHAAVNFLTPVRWPPTTIGYADGHTEVLPRDDKRDGVITDNTIDLTNAPRISLNAFTSGNVTIPDNHFVTWQTSTMKRDTMQATTLTVGHSPKTFYVRDGVLHMHAHMSGPDVARAVSESLGWKVKGVVQDCDTCKGAQ